MNIHLGLRNFHFAKLASPFFGDSMQRKYLLLHLAGTLLCLAF